MKFFNNIFQNYSKLLKVHKDKKKDSDSNNLVFVYFYRPLSFFPAALLAALGVSANQLTIFRAILFSFVFLLIPFVDKSYDILLIFLLLLSEILDFADGNIARLTGTSSALGKFIDGLLDIISNSVFFLLPFLSQKNNTSIFEFSSEVLLAFIVFSISSFYVYFMVRLDYLLKFLRPKEISTPTGRIKPLSIKRKIYNVFQDSFLIMIFVASFFSFYSEILLFFLVTRVPLMILEIILRVRKSEAELVKYNY